MVKRIRSAALAFGICVAAASSADAAVNLGGPPVRAMTAEESAALDRFIMHYERITRSMIAGKHRATVVVPLNEHRAPSSQPTEGRAGTQNS